MAEVRYPLAQAGKGIITVLSLLLVSCASHSPAEVSRPLVPPAGHIVSASAHVVAMDYWAPSEEEIKPFEDALAQLFANPPPKFKAQIRLPFSDYLLKYYGDVRDGKKSIYAEGFHISHTTLAKLQEENNSPERFITVVDGGGSYFFHAVYDVAAAKPESFYFNAPY